MRYAEVHCPNPSCGAQYGALVEEGYHAACPGCGQVNRVPGKDLSEEIDGLCKSCRKPLDDHLFGRLTFACPPKEKK